MAPGEVRVTCATVGLEQTCLSPRIFDNSEILRVIISFLNSWLEYFNRVADHGTVNACWLLAQA